MDCFRDAHTHAEHMQTTVWNAVTLITLDYIINNACTHFSQVHALHAYSHIIWKCAISREEPIESSTALKAWVALASLKNATIDCWDNCLSETLFCSFWTVNIQEMQPADLDLMMCCRQITGAHSCLDLRLCIMIFVAWLSVARLRIRLTMNVPRPCLCVCFCTTERVSFCRWGQDQAEKLLSLSDRGRSGLDQDGPRPRRAQRLLEYKNTHSLLLSRMTYCCFVQDACVFVCWFRCLLVSASHFRCKILFSESCFWNSLSNFSLLLLLILSAYLFTHLLNLQNSDNTHPLHAQTLCAVTVFSLLFARSDVTEEEEIRVNSPNCYFKLSNVFLLSTRVVLQGGRFGVLYFNKGQMNTEAD